MKSIWKVISKNVYIQTLYKENLNNKILSGPTLAGIRWSIVFKYRQSSSGQSVDGEEGGEEQGSFFLDFSFPIMGEEDN
jgi:hypothetical protein